MVGAKKGEMGVTGAMVIGIVPFSFLEAGVIGVALIGLLWGVFLAFFDRWLLVKLSPGVSETVYAYIAFRVVVSSVWGAERVMVNLARGFSKQGLKVDLVLAKAEGP